MTQTPRLVVITGVNGFVGTHVALKFLKEGWRVRGSVRSEEKRQIVLHNPTFAGMLDRLEVVVIESLASAEIEGFLGGCQAVSIIGSESSETDVCAACPCRYGESRFVG